MGERHAERIVLSFHSMNKEGGGGRKRREANIPRDRGFKEEKRGKKPTIFLSWPITWKEERRGGLLNGVRFP